MRKRSWAWRQPAHGSPRTAAPPKAGTQASAGRCSQQPFRASKRAYAWQHPPTAIAAERSLGLRNLHAAELGSPLVKRRTANAAGEALRLDRHACLGLLEEADDLLFSESDLPHVRHSLGG